MLTVHQRIAQITPKLERAKKHIRDTDDEILCFLKANPYKVSTKRDPQSRRLIYFVSAVQPVPHSIALTAGDAIQNIMSTLDHLAYQLVCAATNDNPPNPRRIYFPIAEDFASYNKIKAGKMDGARRTTIDAIDAIKPYKGGNDHLWILHRLNNADKHRLLLTVGSAFRSVNLGAHIHASMQELWNEPGSPFKRQTAPILDFSVEPADTLFPLKIGDELFIDAPDAEVIPKMEFKFGVALSEPPIVEAQSVPELLDRLTVLVEEVVSKLESELA